VNICPVCGATNGKTAPHCQACGEVLGAVVKPEAPLKVREEALPTNTLLRDGRYTVLHTVGRGGFAITYRAFDAKHKLYVAIKELFPYDRAIRAGLEVVPNVSERSSFAADMTRFEREAELLKRIKHPACVAAFDAWQENKTVYMAMEFLEGETLEARLARRGTIFESEALRLLDILLEALVEVHAQGVLHRDLKPANIVLLEDYPEIVDFGSARGADQGVSERILTPAYAPLEQYGQHVTEHPSTDLYALSATFYEAVTGRPPETALHRAQGQGLTPVRQRNPLISAVFAEAIERGLEMQIRDRHDSANDMRAALGLLRVKSSVTAPPNPMVIIMTVVATLIASAVFFSIIRFQIFPTP
jgi:serine/threonine protein kinase